jgi:murein DD-endopeptidase MepM/ murein hydrolase activator NlpD
MDTAEMAAAMAALQDTPYQMFDIWVDAAETVAERIPYETTLVPNDENFDGIRTMISPGADGLAQVSYRIWYDPETGEELSREETARVVVHEPVSAVSYEGLYPLPDGVSTGTFDWPLPPLPDDELPLDENGNPYMPENPLALKNTYISSGYGERDLWGTYDFHLGLDIVAPANTEIYAADGGVVQFAAFTSSYGYMTRIRHADNVETVYAHQIKLAVKPGDIVQKGQLIGYVGSTGNSSGSHLHLEFRRDHVTVDPLEYIEIPDEITVLGEGY